MICINSEVHIGASNTKFQEFFRFFSSWPDICCFNKQIKWKGEYAAFGRMRRNT